MLHLVWNQLPLSFCKPHSGTSSSISYSPILLPITSSSSDSPIGKSITPSLFQSRLKTYLSHKSHPRRHQKGTGHSESLLIVFIVIIGLFVTGAQMSLSTRLLQRERS